MCGIAAMFAYRDSGPDIDHSMLHAVNTSMASRGPDGCGIWIANNRRLGLAHTRLNIIDLDDRANQPMASADGRYQLVFNGAIYNFKALRSQLKEDGYRFLTQSDTEVLLALYTTLGQKMVTRVRGMFALLIWDNLTQELFFARDPYGIKPLYYADTGCFVMFASQVRAVRTSPYISKEPCSDGIAGFCTFGTVPEPRTIFKSIKALGAGMCGTVKMGRGLESQCYADIAKTFLTASNNDSVAGECRGSIIKTALRDSVSSHMTADVPVGIFLSSGIDSGALLGLMRDVSDKPIDAFTLVAEQYHGSVDDELPLAETTARQYAANHFVHSINHTEIKRLLPDFFRHMDQPSIDGLNTWLISRAAALNGNKVMLTGLGGDELFGGYPSFMDIPRWLGYPDSLRNSDGLAIFWRKLVTWMRAMGLPVSPKIAGFPFMVRSVASAYLLKRGLFLPWELSSVLHPDFVQSGVFDSGDKYIGIIDQAVAIESESAGDAIAAMESCLYMRNQLLRDADWSGMSHSVEIRTPLVDHTLLKKVAGLIEYGERVDGKVLLANAPSQALTGEHLSRQKTGFTLPFSHWLDSIPELSVWRANKSLTHSIVPWSRRWAYVVLHHYFPDNDFLLAR